MKKISYILYKLNITNNDLFYIYEFMNQKELKEHLKKKYNLNNVKDYISKDINNIKPLKNNLVILKENNTL